MKRQLFTYILAAFCATAILSCNKEAAQDSNVPDTDEYTVLLTASIDASTKGVSIGDGKVVSTWSVGDVVELVRDSDADTISTLKVISVNGNQAQLSGKVRGSTAKKDIPMSLYYGGTCYDYSGQDGTVESAASKAYLKAATQIDSVVGKTFYLHDAVMEHQQSYMGLSFYRGATRLKVHSVAIVKGGQNIIKRHPHDSSNVKIYDTEPFIVKSPSTFGQEVFYFALSDTTTNSIDDHKYELEITTITALNSTTNDTTVYKGTVAPANLKGNYFADAKVILERVSSVITAPTVYPAINHDGLPHNLVIPAVLQPGAIAKYGVSTIPEILPTVWSTSIPTRTEVGSYTIWYKVEGGDYYDDILETMVGTTFIKPTSIISFNPPTTAGTLTYNGAPQGLLTYPAIVKANDTPISPATVEYFVRDNSAVPPTGDEETGWSSTYPPQKTNAGTYYIWYRYNGDSSLGYLPAMDGPVTVKINQLSVTVKANDQSVPVGGTFDINVTGATLTGAVSGHTLFSVTLTPSIGTSATGSGTMTISHDAVIKNGETDVTANYDITYSDGTITVY